MTCLGLKPSIELRPSPGDDGDHPTFCRLCEAFCGMMATVRDGRVVKISPDRDNPHSAGHICVKGPAIADIAYDPDRVTQPLKRGAKPGEFTPVSWEEAIADISARLGKALADHGPDSVAAYLGNPSAFSTDTFVGSQWFLNRIGARKLYTAGSQDGNSRHLASFILYGITSRRCIPDLPNADMLIIIGANPLVSHGSFLTAPRIRHDLDAIAARGRVVVVDPRRTETARKYDHVPIRPDSDCWLLAAMLRIVVEDDLVCASFLRDHVEGWDDLARRVTTFSIEQAAERTGITDETIRSLTHEFARVERAAIYSRTGLCRGTLSTLANVLVDALNISTGKFGRVGGSVFGAFPFGRGGAVYAGYEIAETRLGNVPVVSGMWPCAVLASDILEPGVGQVRALLLVAGNPVLSAPGGETLAAALDSLDLFVSSDLYINESNRYADYILPSTTFLEKADLPVIGAQHMPRPFLQYAPPVIPPIGEAREEVDVFNEIASRMALDPIAPKEGMRPLDVFDAALQTRSGERNGGAAIALSIETLRAHPHGLMLDEGLTYSGWQDYVATPDSKIRLWHPLIVREFDRLETLGAGADSSGLRLFSQRYLKSLNSWMHNTAGLVHSQTPALLICPDDARARNIADGDRVSIASRHGSVTVTVRVTGEVMRGSVCYPHGWGHNGGWQTANDQAGANINSLLGHGLDVMDPVSGMTLMDGLPVEVSSLRDHLS